MTQLFRQGSVSIGHNFSQQTDTSSHTSHQLTNPTPAGGNRLLMPHIKESTNFESPLSPTSSMSPRSEDTMSPNANQCLETPNPQNVPNTSPTKLSPTPGSPTEFQSHNNQQHYSPLPTAPSPFHPPPHYISRHPQIISGSGSPPLKHFVSSITNPQSPNSLKLSKTSSPPPTKTSFCIEALLSNGKRDGPNEERGSVVTQHQPLAPTMNQDEQNHNRMMSAELAQRFMMRGQMGHQHQTNLRDDEEMQYADERDYSPSPDEDGSR